MKITDYINRPGADDILVRIEVTITEDEKGLSFSADDYGTVAEYQELYKVGETIDLTPPEQRSAEDIAIARMEFLKDRASDNVEEL